MKIHTNTKTSKIQLKIIVKYQFHLSILIIKNKTENTNIFRFKHLMLSDVKKMRLKV